MRLLDATSFQLRSFEENAIPPYAILSHTWGDDEVSFRDIGRRDAASKAGYKKIEYVCADARRIGLEYVWVDTCCIDKTSSAELSEAINSMFRWYRMASYCYAYLVDVPDAPEISTAYSEHPSPDFAGSRWFSRGWTLQELLAPEIVRFYSSGGRFLGSKLDLKKEISRITSIGEGYLTGASSLWQASIAKRMSWASSRQTTRTEDLAYCLLGIFDISMPLLYGEGNKAFIRLQEEIMRNSDDQSLFTWGYRHFYFPDRGEPIDDLNAFPPFAIEPAAFQESGHIVPDKLEPPTTAFTLTNRGLQIHLRVHERLSRFPCPVAILACRPEERWLWLIGFPIRFLSEDSFQRIGKCNCFLIRRDEVLDTPYRSLRFLLNDDSLPREARGRQHQVTQICLIRRVPEHDASAGLSIWEVQPRDAWDPEQRMIALTGHADRHIVLRLWRKKGEGYAIVLEHVGGYRYPPDYSDTSLRKWRYCVYQETLEHPHDYESYSLSRRMVFSYNHERTSDIKISVDQEVVKELETSIQMIDIEIRAHADRKAEEIDLQTGKGALPSRSITEMAQWSSYNYM